MNTVNDYNKIANDQALTMLEKQRAYIQYMYRQSLLNAAYKAQRRFMFSAGFDPEMIIVLNHIYDESIKKDKFNQIALENSIYNNIVITNI